MLEDLLGGVLKLVMRVLWEVLTNLRRMNAMKSMECGIELGEAVVFRRGECDLGRPALLSRAQAKALDGVVKDRTRQLVQASQIINACFSSLTTCKCYVQQSRQLKPHVQERHQSTSVPRY